jgi:hypothetical protein
MAENPVKNLNIHPKRFIHGNFLLFPLTLHLLNNKYGVQ